MISETGERHLTKSGIDGVPHLIPGTFKLKDRIAGQQFVSSNYPNNPWPGNNEELLTTAKNLAKIAQNPTITANLSAEERKMLFETIDALGERRLRDQYYDLYPETGPLRRDLYPFHMEHYEAGNQFRERAFMAGNRVGKTTCGAFETTAHLTGIYRDMWPGRRFNEPIRAWACAKKNIKLRDVVQPKLFGRSKKNDAGRYILEGSGMIPAESIIHDSAIFKQGFSAVCEEINIRYKDSKYEFSTLGMRSYKEGRGTFEGTSQHWIWLDEEPPMDIYSECTTRIMDADGMVAMTYTPLDGFTDVVIAFLPAELRPIEVSGDFDEQEDY